MNQNELPQGARWALFYIKLTWFSGTLAFNFVTLSMLDGLEPLKDTPKDSILIVLYGLGFTLSLVASIIFYRFLKPRTLEGTFMNTQIDPAVPEDLVWVERIRKLVPKYALVWGLGDGVFMYGAMCARLTGELTYGLPLMALGLLFAAISYPGLDELCLKLIQSGRDQTATSPKKAA